MPKPEILRNSNRNLLSEDVEISANDQFTLLKTIATEKEKKNRRMEKADGFQ